MGKLEADIEWLKKQLSNHLAHHEKYLWWIIATIAGGLILNALM
jgi:hypothetical protein